MEFARWQTIHAQEDLQPGRLQEPFFSHRQFFNIAWNSQDRRPAKRRIPNQRTIFLLRQGETVMPMADACRQLGASGSSFSLWRKQYAG